MSFTYGSFSTASMTGLKAGLKNWIALPSLALDMVDAPGSDGAFYAGVNLGTHPGFVFDVYIQGASRAGCQTMVDEFTRAVSPLSGLQNLTPGGYEGWVWRAVLANQIQWAWGTWLPGSPWQMRADVAFLCPDPYGYATPDEGITWTTVGSRAFTRALGNTASHPTLDITGTLTSSQTVTVTVNGVAVAVTGPLTSSQILRLDYQSMDFGIWTGSTKTANIVSRMSVFDRLSLNPGANTVTVATSGTIASCQLQANSRRV